MSSYKLRNVVQSTSKPFSSFSVKKNNKLCIMHILEGDCYIEEKGAEKYISPGATLILFRDLSFRLYAKDRPYRALCIHSPRIGFKATYHESVLLAPDETLSKLAKSIIAYLGTSTMFKDDLVNNASEYFASLAYRKMENLLGIRKKDKQYWIQFGKDLIDSTLEENAELKLIFKDIPFSYEYFTRIFKSQTGVSPQVYKDNRRIERAKEMLLVKELSVTSIAYELGYSSSQHFSAHFKSKVGVTPMSYRTLSAKIKNHNLHYQSVETPV